MKQWLQDGFQRLTGSAEVATLHRLNAVLAGLFGVQAVVVAVFSQTISRPISASYVQLDQLASDASGSRVLVPVVQAVSDVRLAYLAAVALVVLAIYHGLMASKLRPLYENGLKRHVIQSRWTSLAVVFSLLQITVALALGISDLAVLVAIVALAVITNMTGLLMEQRYAKRLGRQEPVRWGLFYLGSLAGALPWFIYIYTLIITHSLGAGVPLHTWLSFAAIFVLNALYPLLMLLQFRRQGRWQDYVVCEKAYSVIGLLAASAVAWLIFTGSLPL